MKRILTLTAALGLVFSATFASADTYAFMMGINDYPDVVDDAGKPLLDEEGNVIDNDLTGCVNDIKNYSDLMVNKFGLAPDHVKAIFDKEVGEDGFIGGFKWLIQNAKPGDQIIFCYSGHGGQIDDEEEPDGIEEVIVLADNKLVPGDFFHDLSESFSKAGINSSFVFDSCFSGGMSRNVFQYDNKPGTAKLKVANPLSTARMKEVPSLNLSEMVAAPKQSAAATKAGEYAFIFAGTEDQPTIDLSFKDPATPSRGLFSLLFGALLEDDPNISIAEAIQTIQEILKEKGFDQKPGFEVSSPDRGKLGLIEK